MEDSFKRDNREDVYSEVIRAGKRTYFLDVKETRAGERYLTITESKRRFNNDTGKFFYEKHKIFLYKEDFDKFVNGLNDVLNFIETGEIPVREEKPADDISFEDLKSDDVAEDKDSETDEEPPAL
jgi:hypothetical protein